ncbi:MAG TPA: ABC transporter permease [Anaerolineae bacterium]
MRRLRAIMKKEFTHMRRDPRTLMAVLLMPILQLLLLGYASNTDVRNVPTVVFDQDNSQASRALLDAYRATGYFSIDYVAYSDADVNKLIEGGRARVGITIPPTFNIDIQAGRQAQVSVLIDGSDPSIASTALSAATLVGQSRGAAIRLQQLSARGAVGSTASALDVRTRVLYNPDLKSAYNMVPGLIAMILMQTTTNLTSSAIVKEREVGTIEQLIVTPIRNWELIIAKITPYILVSLLNMLVILLIGTLWFQVPIRGSFTLLFALTGLYLVPNLAIGLLISTFAKTQREAQMMTMPIMLPSMMLSGFFFPIAALPAALQVISQFLPLTYFLIIVRAVVVKGATFDLLLPQILALSAFAVVLLGFAMTRFRKSLD